MHLMINREKSGLNPDSIFSGLCTEKNQKESTPPAEDVSAVENTREEAQKTGPKTDEIIRNLDRNKKELDLEYQALMKEKKELDGRKTFKNKKAAQEHNKSVSELNKRIDSYERKKQAFNAEVEKYNVTVRKEMEALLESKQTKK